MADKIFIGKVNSTTMNGNSGSWEKIGIALGPEDFSKLAANRNEKGWVNLLFKESNQGKKYLEIDTWVPVRKQDAPGYQEQPENHNFTPPPEDDFLAGL